LSRKNSRQSRLPVGSAAVCQRRRGKSDHLPEISEILNSLIDDKMMEILA